jgi:hypothetical protein
MSPKSKVAARHINLLDRVRTEIRTTPPRFVIIERVDRPSVPVMFSITRKGDCE